MVPKKTNVLPLTHELGVPSDDESQHYADFSITVLGFALGLRLVPEGWKHFYRIAVEPGKLSDVARTRDEAEHVLATAHGFWRRHRSPDIRRQMFGLIHWFLFSQSYEHEFERFSGQYTVLDACFRLLRMIEHVPKEVVRGKHAARVPWLCARFAVAMPSWARQDDDEESWLSRVRNNLVHEARFGTEPIGFGRPESDQFQEPDGAAERVAGVDTGPDVDGPLRDLNVKLILGLLNGVPPPGA